MPQLRTARPLSFARSPLLYEPEQVANTLEHPTILAGLAQITAFCQEAAAPQPRWPNGSKLPEMVTERQACEFDQKRYAQRFFPDYCHAPFSRMHEDFFTIAEDRLRSGERGWRDATAAPRGGGKTTVKLNIQLSHAILYGFEHYILICSANADLAVDKVRGLRDLFTNRMDLIEAYGPMKTDHWRQNDFVTANGCRVRAFTPKSASRGVLWLQWRPTLILLDDAEDDESVLTEYQRQQTAQWFNEKVAKLGDKDTNIDVIGTIIHPQSLLAGLLKNPGYTGRHYRAVEQFSQTPTSWELWEQWRQLVIQLDNPQRLADARAFYLAHETAMLEGTAVLWPAREDYYTLMLSRVIEGEPAFAKEKQNQPEKDARRVFDSRQVGFCQVRQGEIVRANGSLVPWIDITDVAAYWDPTPDKDRVVGSDFAACAVVAKDRHGYTYLLDMYLKQEGSTDQQQSDIALMLYRWQVPLLGMESNNFQGLLKNSMREKLQALATRQGSDWTCTLLPVANTRNKAARIATLEPLLHNHWLQLSTTLPSEFTSGEFYRQLFDYIPGVRGLHDDGPDALEGAQRTVHGMLDSRSSAAA